MQQACLDTASGHEFGLRLRCRSVRLEEIAATILVVTEESVAGKRWCPNDEVAERDLLCQGSFPGIIDDVVYAGQK